MALRAVGRGRWGALLLAGFLAVLTAYNVIAYNTRSASLRRLEVQSPESVDGRAARGDGGVGEYQSHLHQVKQESDALLGSLGVIEQRLWALLRPATAGRASLPTPRTGYTFWSSDFHISPIADLKDLLEPMGMTIIDKSLSGHCHLKGTCATDLKVLTRDNGIDLGRCPNQLRRDFFEAYKNDPAMQHVDAFICQHACGLCEVFMPFNKSLIVIASTRYEIGRHTPDRWRAWNENLKNIASNPRNIVAANNLYDAEYIKYFTGLRNVPVIPNYCGYTKESYSPQRPEILVGPGRGVHEELLRELQERGRSRGVSVARIRDLYPHFEYSQLVQHPAIVLIPYQVSVMSIFEYYRMGIPLFAPSPALLAKWQIRHRVMNERTWEGVFGRPGARSAIRGAEGTEGLPDPNNEEDEHAIRHWIALADFYQWPHIQTFDSFEELFGKLADADLEVISRGMQAYNQEIRHGLKQQWEGILERIFDRPPAAVTPHEQVMDFDRAMAALYSVQVHGSCLGETQSSV